MAKFSHKYEVTECPDCGADLTQPESVILVATGRCSACCEEHTRLDQDGNLIDVDDLIDDGLHSDTLCRRCLESLGDYEEDQ